MNYKVLARKWRPKKIADVIGQQHITQAIIQSFRLNRIHHAYVFYGMHGVGKTTIGRLFAKKINCVQQLQSDICEKCDNCKNIESGNFIDLIEIDAASKTKVEDTREFLEDIQYYPSQGKYKIYLIDEVHMLSKHSFNALLKTLEEPPEHVKFILITTVPQKIPETVLSRCLQFYLKPLSVSQISTQLMYICKQEDIVINTHALELIAYAAKGSMRDALNLLEQSMLVDKDTITIDVTNNMLGMSYVECSVVLIESLLIGDINQIMHQIDNCAISGINWDHLLNEMLIILQRIAMTQFSLESFKKKENDNNIKYIENRVYNLSTRLTPENVQLYYQIFLIGRRELPYFPNYRMGLEMIMLRALAFYPINIVSNDLDRNQNSDKLLKNSGMMNFSEAVTNNLHDKSDNIKDNFVLNSKKLIPENCNQYSEDMMQKLKDTDDNADVITENSEITNVCSLDQNLKTDKSCQNISSNLINSEITNEILQARSDLITYKKQVDESKTKLDSCSIDKSIKSEIFERFCNINRSISQDIVNNKKKVKN